jgi:hypothetical protein
MSLTQKHVLLADLLVVFESLVKAQHFFRSKIIIFYLVSDQVRSGSRVQRRRVCPLVSAEAQYCRLLRS